jgi:hypothetical protein
VSDAAAGSSERGWDREEESGRVDHEREGTEGSMVPVEETTVMTRGAGWRVRAIGTVDEESRCASEEPGRRSLAIVDASHSGSASVSSIASPGRLGFERPRSGRAAEATRVVSIRGRSVRAIAGTTPARVGLPGASSKIVGAGALAVGPGALPAGHGAASAMAIDGEIREV